MSLGVELSFRTGFLYAYGLMKPGLGETIFLPLFVSLSIDVFVGSSR